MVNINEVCSWTEVEKLGGTLGNHIVKYIFIII